MQVLHRQSSHASQQMSAAAFPIASVVASVASAITDSIAEIRAALPQVLMVCICVGGLWYCIETVKTVLFNIRTTWLLSGLSAARLTTVLCLCSMASHA